MPRAKLARLAFSSLAVLLAIWLIWLLASSEVFRNCEHERQNHEAYQALREEGFLLVKGLARTRLLAACAAHVANTHQGAITALGGVAVAFFTFVLMVVSIGQWGAARLSADAAAKSAEVAERTLVLAQRPWIQVQIEPYGPLTVKGKGVSIALKLTMINVGGTPALWVKPSVKAVVRTQETWDAGVHQRKMAEEARARPHDLMGRLIFPNSGISEHINLGPTPDEVRATLAGREPDLRSTVMIYLIGSVSYRFPFNDERHQTGFMYDIMVMHEASPHPSLFIDLAGDDIPRGRWVINVSSDGSPYVD